MPNFVPMWSILLKLQAAKQTLAKWPYLITANCKDKQSKQQTDDYKNHGMYAEITNTEVLRVKHIRTTANYISFLMRNLLTVVF